MFCAVDVFFVGVYGVLALRYHYLGFLSMDRSAFMPGSVTRVLCVLLLTYLNDARVPTSKAGKQNIAFQNDR